MNAELRRNTRPYVEENYSWKIVAKSVAEVYQNLLEEKEVQD
jgi:hypothetical protein